jgi:MoxR-like ATPase
MYRFNPPRKKRKKAQEEERFDIDGIRKRIMAFNAQLKRYFVEKSEIIDLMTVCAVAQEPLLLVGTPGTGKSDLVTKFCQGLSLGPDEYYEYTLTKFTEPTELLGPLDLSELKLGRYIRKTGGMLPEARVAFLDEIFKANSAILNSLLTILNERKYYQGGRPVDAQLLMLFAATNRIPEYEELGALRDRFTLKVESTPARNREDLLLTGLSNQIYKKKSQDPWRDSGATLQDFIEMNRYLYQLIGGEGSNKEAMGIYRERFFPNPVFDLFNRILMTLERENNVYVSDRKYIKLFQLIQTRALLFHGGAVRPEDLILLGYIGDTDEDIPIIREKVAAILRLS